MIHWGIIATGHIASIFAKGLAGSRIGKLAAIASRAQVKADRFGLDNETGWGDFLKDRPDIKRYGSYEALLADKSIDAVYIATPHPQHLFWTCRAAEAGKHILCEKPLGLNHAEAMIACEFARRYNVCLLEAFMYRCHPQISEIIKLLQTNAIGQVRAIQANFSFNCGPNYENRALKNSLGGGGILDVGCYVVSLARLVAGVAFGQSACAEPADMKAQGHLGPTGVDEYAACLLKFINPADPKHEILANLATGVQVNMNNTAKIYGAAGSITLYEWVPRAINKITLQQSGKDPVDIPCETPPGVTAYTLEADLVAHAVANRKLQADFPAMTWSDSLNNMKVLDHWRQHIGQIYDSEKPENLTAPQHGRPLAAAPNAFMPYAPIPGLAKRVSRLFLGVMADYSPERFPHAAAMLDDFFERGGNAFDTAHIYAGGRAEKALGAWHQSRKVRGQIVILGKGAHPPNTNPRAVTIQLKESLERMQTDYVDLYMMHRDNPDIPIGEFADVLHEHVSAGRIKTLGASNWSLPRFEAFNDYAKKHRKTPLVALSDNLSLARMVEAPWPGCVCANDPARLAWHEKTQTALLSWSSQARGFFVHGDSAYTADPELVRSWYSSDNFARLGRAKQLAKKKGVAPLQINLAWVLTQKFPTFALIGPRTIEETRTSLEGLRVQLTPEEVQWLLNG